MGNSTENGGGATKKGGSYEANTSFSGSGRYQAIRSRKGPRRLFDNRISWKPKPIQGKIELQRAIVVISSLRKIRNDAKLFCEKNHRKWHLTYLSAMFGNYFFCNCSYLFLNLFKMPVCIYGLLEISIFVFYDWCVNF